MATWLSDTVRLKKVRMSLVHTREEKMGPHRESGVRRVIGRVVVALTAIAATGCAHALSQPMPEAKGRLALKVSQERPSGRMVKVKAQWVWVKRPLERTAEVLEETEEALVVVPDVADAFVFAGVNILDKKSVTVTAEPK